MSLAVFAIISPLVATAVLIVLAINLSNRDVAKFQALEAERQSNATRSTIAREATAGKGSPERYFKTTSALTMFVNEPALATVAAAEFKPDDAALARIIRMVQEEERSSKSGNL